MGNQCCQSEHISSPLEDPLLTYQKQPIPVTTPPQLQQASAPSLSNSVQENLQRFKPFQQKLAQMKDFKVYKIGKHVYKGQLNQAKKPNGVGTIYMNDKSIYIGQFKNGIAYGQGHYVLADGSCYIGHFQNNTCNDEKATYLSNDRQVPFIYKGSIKNNVFHGAGQEEGLNHIFQGTYSNGKKIDGLLKWNQPSQNQNNVEKSNIYAFEYKGGFDQNQKFSGPGHLRCSKGQYKGNFQNNMKNGQGQFKYSNGMTYKGNYKDNIRQGYGQWLNTKGQPLFKGNFKNGLPDGKGTIFSNGNIDEIEFDEGLSTKIKIQKQSHINGSYKNNNIINGNNQVQTHMLSKNQQYPYKV